MRETKTSKMKLLILRIVQIRFNIIDSVAYGLSLLFLADAQYIPAMLIFFVGSLFAYFLDDYGAKNWGWLSVSKNRETGE